MSTGFSKEVCDKLGFYVYLYVDPRTGKVFYVGKGKDNRAFSHLNVDGDTDKAERLRELRALGLEPQIEILRYGLTDDIAKHVEAAAIEVLKLDELVNEIHGHGADFGPRDHWLEVQNRFSSATVAIHEKAMLFNITNSFRPGHSVMQLYDVTRSAWVVNRKKADEAEFAFAMYAGVVREVYKIQQWVPAGSTLTSNEGSGRDPTRWEFVGNLAPPTIRDKYKGKRIDGLIFSQNLVRYLNFARAGSFEE